MFMRRSEQWIERRTEVLAAAQIYQEQPLLRRLVPEKAEHKRVIDQNRAIHPSSLLLTQAYIFAAYFNEVTVEIAHLLICLAFGPIELARFERFPLRRDRQTLSEFRRGCAWTL